MAYTDVNFRSKKALKEAVAANLAGEGPEVTVFQPGLGTVPENGRIFLEGPHYPEAHRFYAEATMENGKVVKVK